ncbi:hypothetical protein LIER_22065 [Lithospermum erythrorhizon]|uniref:BURP domain-containing protein n=1 Tax=Lithospermum erythrorhizon TaxID=34254 RepID=A0AAV3QWN9_LITER
MIHNLINSDIKLILQNLHVTATEEEMQKKHVQGHSSVHHNMDPSVNVFFLLDDLKKGNQIPIFFPRRDPSSTPHLSKEEADSIPFSYKEIQLILHYFSFSQDSPQAKAMEDTLRECEAVPIVGETKFCPTSTQSMLNFVHYILGTVTEPIKSMSTTHLTEATNDLRSYTIMEDPEEIPAPKLVSCHTMPYAYAVFYCHYQESESRIFKVSLRSEEGDRVEGMAACHMDTSHWGQNHVSFKVLGIKPGSSAVCHFFPSDNYMFVAETSIQSI